MNAVLRRETESKLEMAPPTVGRKVWLKLQNQDKVIRGFVANVDGLWLDIDFGGKPVKYNRNNPRLIWR